MAIQRLEIERLLTAYVSALADAVEQCSSYQDHLTIAKSLLFRWQGGESIGALRDALWLEWKAYNVTPPPKGTPPEGGGLVGTTFGSLCRGSGVKTRFTIFSNTLLGHYPRRLSGCR